MNLQNYTAELTYKPLKAERTTSALSYSKTLQLLIIQLTLNRNKEVMADTAAVSGFLG